LGFSHACWGHPPTVGSLGEPTAAGPAPGVPGTGREGGWVGLAGHGRGVAGLPNGGGGGRRVSGGFASLGSSGTTLPESRHQVPGQHRQGRRRPHPEPHRVGPRLGMDSVRTWLALRGRVARNISSAKSSPRAAPRPRPAERGPWSLAPSAATPAAEPYARHAMRPHRPVELAGCRTRRHRTGAQWRLRLTHRRHA
jgi:hypothetical protein